MNWNYVALNPYGIEVQENENGIRRYRISGGWKEETDETIDVCRAKSKEEMFIASKVMTNINISASFKHNPYVCTIVWLTPKGIKTKINEQTIEKTKANPKGIAFKKLIENEIGKRVVFSWMSGKKWNEDLPKWNYAIKMKSPTLCRGIQIGVAKIIEKRFKDDLWTELGLVNSSDSSTWILPSEKRKLYSKKIDDNSLSPYAVQQYILTPFKKLSEKGNSFNSILDNFNNEKETNIEETEEVDNINIYKRTDVKKLLWVTERSVHNFGWENIVSWKDWFAKKNAEGIIVFEGRELEKKFKFYEHLDNKGIERYEIKLKEESFIVYIVSEEIKKTNKELSIEEWAGEAPKINKRIKIIKEDEFGRVPYRALSKISSPVGMIPMRLEENIHSALLKLEEKHGNVDKLVSKLMGVKRKDLVNYVSAEQVDAIALFYDAFSRKQDALLADETGFGKGRILASLLKIGLKLGKTVIFVTENSQLFSDFFRDITDVYGEEPDIIPTILHGNAKVFTPSGKLVAKMTYNSKPYKKMIEQSKFDKDETPLIFTTYSQMNKANKKGSNFKVEWLKNRLKQNKNGCWLILDEAHNAAGDSNVNDNLEALLKYTDGALFSSATFAKTEKNLSVFKRAMDISPWLYSLLNNAIENDEGEMREALTTSMARKGNFIRREHKPIDPPNVNWIEMDEEKEIHLKNFALFWRRLHETIAFREELAGGFKGLAWAKIGSYLSRTVKEFSFLMKVDKHIEHILDSLSKDIKPVLAIESTFESAFKSVLEKELEGVNENEEGDMDIIVVDEEDDTQAKRAKPKKASINGMIIDHIPLWKERLSLIAEKALNMPELMESNPDPKNIEILEKMFKETLSVLDFLPNWDLMPVEKILREINAKGYEVGELSGRMHSYEKTEDGNFKIVALEKPDRVKLVSDFNSGIISFLVLTLAGCTGISVHAGAKFKDQRRRELIEGEIAVNSSKRIQFWGRVRRKDQVIEPIFNRFALSILSEKRTQAREDKKKEMLAAHVGMKQDFDMLSWISLEGEDIIQEWAFDRKRYATQIGVTKAVEGNPCGRVDRALLRSIILPIEEQEGILNRLDRGLNLMNEVAKKEKNIGVIKKSSKIREGWLLGHPTRNSENPSDILQLPRINYVERVYEKSKQPDFERLISYIKENNKNEVNGDFVLEKWQKAWKYELSVKNILNKDYNDEVGRWICKNLPLCQKGNALQLTRPGENDEALGVVLGFDYPECEGKSKGASSWALSQVAIKVWLVGEEEPIKIPLLRLFRDPLFKIYDQKANISWFKEPIVPFIGMSVEGNPILSAYWGKIWKVGKSVLIEDEDEGIKWIWALPKIWDWKIMSTLPKIALNLNQIYQCFSQHDKDIELKAISSRNESIVARSNGHNVIVEVDHDTMKESFSTWGNPYNRKKFEKINYKARNKDKKPCVSFLLSYRNLISVFASMEKTGIIWQISGCTDEWYKNSSAKVMDEAIKEGVKILNPNKKTSTHQLNASNKK